MKKTIRLVIVLFIAAMAFSCASAPSWFRNVPEKRFTFYGTGSSELKSAEKARKFAVMRARTSIAEQIQATIQQAASDYYQENEMAKNSQAIAFVEEISRQIVNTQIKYTHVEKIERDKEGVTYALLSLKSSDLRRALREKNSALKLQAKLAKNKPAEAVIPAKIADDASQIIQFYIDSVQE